MARIQNVLNALTSIELGICFAEKQRGSSYGERKYMTYNVLKHSMFHAVSKDEMTMSDPIERWEEYQEAHNLLEHLHFANEYLTSIGQEPLDCSEAVMDEFRAIAFSKGRYK